MRLLLSLVVVTLAGRAPVSVAPAPARVAVVLSQESPGYRAALAGFRQQLQSRGVAVEIDVQVDDRAKPAGRDPDLILALGTPAAVAARRDMATVPVVALALHKADLSGLGNATGVYLEFPPEVELAWLRRILPRTKRVGVVYNPAENAAAIARASSVAAGLGLTLVPRPVTSRAQIPDALSSLTNEGQVLWGVADTLVLTSETARSFLLFQFRQRIPFVGLSDAWVKAGALYALDRDWTDLGRQCAELAEQILRGKDPRGLEPAAPRRVLHTVNRNTAEALGLSLPDGDLP